MKTIKRVLCLLCLFGVIFLTGTGSIDTVCAAGSTMEQEIQKAVQSNLYAVKGGGTVKGSQLIDKKGKINEANFEKLTDNAKVQFLTDTLAASDEYVESGKGDTYTQQAWLDSIQGTAGSEMLTAIMAGQKPNYARARQIYQPFSDPVKTLMGLGAIIIVSVLGLVFVLDISYMALPPIQMALGEDCKFISQEAHVAVKVAANQTDEKVGKVALAIYFKKRAVMLIFLGVCLLYLVEGRLYKLVQIVLNLVSGIV